MSNVTTLIPKKLLQCLDTVVSVVSECSRRSHTYLVFYTVQTSADGKSIYLVQSPSEGRPQKKMYSTNGKQVHCYC